MSYSTLAPIISGVGIAQNSVDTYFDNLEEPTPSLPPPEITSQKIVALANIYFEDGQVGKGVTTRNGLIHVARIVDLTVSQVKMIISEFNRLYAAWSSVPIFRYAFGSIVSVTVGQSVNAVCDTDNDVDSFSVDPALPDGLSLDSSTGNISGAAAVEAEEAQYTITAINDNGESTYSFMLTVNPV